MGQEGEEFLSPEPASAQAVILAVGCCAGPWGKPLALSGAELAAGSNCISRSGSKFWTNYANAFKWHHFIFIPEPLGASSDPEAGGVVHSAVPARCNARMRAWHGHGVAAGPSTPVVLDGPTVLLMGLGMPC